MLLKVAPDAEIVMIGSHWAQKLMRLGAPWSFFPYDSPVFLPLFSGDSERFMSPQKLRNADAVLVFSGAPDDDFIKTLKQRFSCVLYASAHPVSGCHTAEHFASAACQNPLPFAELPLPGLFLPEAERNDQLHNPTPNQFPFVVHPGSGTPVKCWPTEHFVKVIQFAMDNGAQPYLLRGPADQKNVAQLQEALQKQGLAVECVCCETLEQAATLLLTASCFLGNDSGVAHLAAALGIAVTAVFGPTSPAVWRPVGKDVRVVFGEGVGSAAFVWPTPEAVWQQIRRAVPEQSNNEPGLA
jgi:hypothetical protein